LKIKEIGKNRGAYQSLVALLAALPDDEVLSNADLLSRGIVLSNSSITSRISELKDNFTTVSIKGRTGRVWGTKKAIAEVRRQFGEN